MTSELGLVALAFLLVFANGFFVATEFSLVKIRPTRLMTLMEEGKPGAQHAMRMVQHLDRYLSATQFGITLASLGLGWVGEPAFAGLIYRAISPFMGESVTTDRVAHTIAVVTAFTLITFLHIVIGELAPKSLAIQQSERTVLSVAWPMRLVYGLMWPGVWLLDSLARWVLKLAGLTTVGLPHEAHSEDELKIILNSSAASGAITAARAELLERALEMVQKTARQVMVPRNQIRFLDLEEPLEKNIASARMGGHTWMPVCRESLDQIEGMVNVKDIFFLLSKGELRSLSQAQRPVLFVPESVTLEQLLSEFRRRRKQMAIVVDEHGGTSGMVTISDVVAELVGDVAELGRKVEEVRTLPGGRLEIPGTAQLDDLEERLGVDFDVEPGDVTTIGGYLMLKLGKVPEKGSTIRLHEYDVRVEEMEGPRVARVSIEPRAAPKPPSTPKVEVSH